NVNHSVRPAPTSGTMRLVGIAPLRRTAGLRPLARPGGSTGGSARTALLDPVGASRHVERLGAALVMRLPGLIPPRPWRWSRRWTSASTERADHPPRPKPRERVSAPACARGVFVRPRQPPLAPARSILWHEMQRRTANSAYT